MAYNKKTWESDEVITQEALNNMEDGIAAAHTAIAATNTVLAGKQAALTPGSGITITDNTISINAAHASEQESTDHAKLASVGKVQELIGAGRRVVPITTWPQTPNTDIIYLVDNSNGSSVITIGNETISAGSSAYAYYNGTAWVVVEDSSTPTPEAIMEAIEEILDTAIDPTNPSPTKVPSSEAVKRYVSDTTGISGLTYEAKVLKELPYGWITTSEKYSQNAKSMGAEVSVTPGDIVRIKANVLHEAKYVFMGDFDTPTSSGNPDKIGDIKTILAGKSVEFIVPNDVYVIHVNTRYFNQTKPYFYMPAIEVAHNWLTQGDIDDETNTKFVHTKPIFGKFMLETESNYRVYRVDMVDRNGNLVRRGEISPTEYYAHLAEAITGSSTYEDLTNTSNFWRLYKSYEKATDDEYGRVVIFAKTDDDTELLPANNITFSDVVLKRLTFLKNCTSSGSTIDGYKSAIHRAYELLNLTWSANGGIITYNSRMVADGQIAVGVPYSNVNHMQKFVGCNVSSRTFMSAIRNPLSVVYTEYVKAGDSNRQASSEYGYTYKDNGIASNFYGTVCSGLVSYVMGLKAKIKCDSMPSFLTSDNKKGSTTDESPITAGDIEPLDILFQYHDGASYAHHTLICLDVLNSFDASDEKLYLIAESNTALTSIAVYTETMLQNRLDMEKTNVHTYDGWSRNKDVNIHDYIYDSYKDFDCMTHLGDYPCIAVGDKMFINARPHDEMDSLEILKEVNGVYQRIGELIDLSGKRIFSNGFVSDTNYAGVDITNEISNTDAGTGKYIVRLVGEDKVSNTSTHFEVVDASVTPVVSNGSIMSLQVDDNVIYAQYGTATGILGSSHLDYYRLSDDGFDNLNWIVSNNYRLLVNIQGDYGVATKDVELLIPSDSE